MHIERLTLNGHIDAPLMQVHFSRYVWALSRCVGKSVLDAGCGVGYGTWIVSTVADNVIGIDIAPDAIAEARQMFGDQSYFQVPLEECDTDPFDVVLAFEMVEHCADVDLALEKVKSLLKADGRAYISLPLHLPNKYHHFRDYGYAEWREIVERYFTVDSVYYQPMEDEPDTTVCILPAGYQVDGRFVEDWHECRMKDEPPTGILLFEVRA